MPTITITATLDSAAWNSADTDDRAQWVHDIENAVNEHAHITSTTIEG